jgi:hypothetical protein
MRVRRAILRGIAVSLLAAMPCVAIVGFEARKMNAPSIPRPQPAPAPHPSVHVTLLGRAADIKGVAVPDRVISGEGPQFFQIDEPSLVLVTLPGGKRVSFSAKTAFINTRFDIKAKTGIVVDVILLPLPKSVSFREAVAELRRLMQVTDIRPNEPMRKEIASWPDESGHFIYRAGMVLNESAALEVYVRPVDTDATFYLVLTFASGGDARRAIWDPYFKPEAKTGPATNGKKGNTADAQSKGK